jgi:hypothetical protein
MAVNVSFLSQLVGGGGMVAGFGLAKMGYVNIICLLPK